MTNEWPVLAAQFAAQNHCVVKWCDAKPLAEARVHIEKSKTPFVSSDIDKRTVPEKIMPGATSIIVLGVGHAVPKRAHWLSSLGVNSDYHIKIKSLLRDLTTLLQTCKIFRYRILVDSGTLDERALAVRAGLGFYGRNGMVISPVFGSFFHIGVLLTDLPFPKNMSALAAPLYPLTDHPARCPVGCRACETACPGKAIPETGYTINVSACISYLTQKDGPLTASEMMAMGQQLYGCDICRQVCPLARPLDECENMQTTMLTLPEEWLTMTDRQFVDRYGHTAMLWRGTAILRRNALIVLGNTVLGNTVLGNTVLGNTTQTRLTSTEQYRLVSLVQRYLSHRDEGIAAAARFAYTRLTTN